MDKTPNYRQEKLTLVDHVFPIDHPEALRLLEHPGHLGIITGAIDKIRRFKITRRGDVVLEASGVAQIDTL